MAHEFSDPPDWRGRRIHILGGSPPKQLEAIRQLTRPTLSADPPADIVGVDWNGLHRGAQFGEFWKAHGIWPETTPQDEGLHIEYGGPTPAGLGQAACTECGANVWRTRRGPYVTEYGTGAVCGYCRYECYFTHRHRNNLEEIAGEQSVYIPPA